MNFDAENETYVITGYKNDKRKYMKMSDITSMVKDVEKTLAPYFKEIEEIAYSNQEKF